MSEALQWGGDDFPEGDREMWDEQYMRGREVDETTADGMLEGRVFFVEEGGQQVAYGVRVELPNMTKAPSPEDALQGKDVTTEEPRADGGSSSQVDWEQFHRDIVPDRDPRDHGFDGSLNKRL